MRSGARTTIGASPYFGRVGRRKIPVPGEFDQKPVVREAIFNRSSGSVVNKRTGQTAVMKPLDGQPVEVGPDDDPRQKLVDWMVDPDEPVFRCGPWRIATRRTSSAGASSILCNDMRGTNPPSNPNCSTLQAKDLVDSHYSLKHLSRRTVKSRTY